MSIENPTSQLEKRIIELEDENKRLHETVAYLTRKLYGSSSEKTSVLGIEDQISLFNEAEIEAMDSAPEPTLDDVVNYRKKKFKGQREELLKDLPREKRLCSLVKEDRFCEHCDSELHSIGEEFVRTEIEFIPAKVRVIDYYREAFECRSCRKKGEPHVEKAPMPYPVIQHSYASPSTVAWVIHQKYEMAIPLYRQEKEWATLGVKLSRATMSKWIMVAHRDWLSPIIDLLHQKLLENYYLHCDETPVQVLQEPGRKNTTDSYMWVYSTAKHSTHPIRFFDYQPGRGGKYPQAFLQNFKGYLHTDAYAGYNKVDGVTQCFCWSHVRRKFVDALPKNLESPESTIPAKAIKFINKLFKIEQELENASAEKRQKERLEQAKPELKAFWSWAEKTAPTVLPKSKLGEAFGYAFNHKEGLMTYLEDGNCSISNNLSENSIRPFTIGRKNWLFSGSPKGATASAGVYTLIQTAKANGLNPTKYIAYILKDIPGSAFMEYPEFLEEYMPWDLLVQKFCK
ncbi:MAG: IS66 family transposase [Cellulosilyticaceae bacterium]